MVSFTINYPVPVLLLNIIALVYYLCTHTHSMARHFIPGRVISLREYVSENRQVQ